MGKNYLFWIGVKPESDTVSKRFKYGDYAWMEYSFKTWKYWCEKNDVTLIHYNETAEDDCMRYKINWQRWFDYKKYIPSDWDSFMLVDASIMVKWDAPNYFDIAPDHMCAMRANENWKWVSESISGYAEMFPDVKFSYKDYFCSGMVVVRRAHEHVLDELASFYHNNIETILLKEDSTVLRGRDQPVINYMVQRHNIPLHHWKITDAVNHLYRRNILGHNWQLSEDVTPFFIKYFNAWQFSGFSDRGDTRTKLMSATWELIKHHYPNV